jgi:hypothetical protein
MASELPVTSAKALDLLRFVTFLPSHSPETGSEKWRVGGGGGGETLYCIIEDN